MTDYFLEIKLLSDSSFASEMGVSGEVDTEIQHDVYGLPIISGRTIKGLLVNSCADIFSVLPAVVANKYYSTAQKLFGVSGETWENSANLSIGNGSLPPDLVEKIKYQVDENEISPDLILSSLTDIRKTTAMDPETGAPLQESLRTERVLLRNNIFIVPLNFASPPEDDEKGLLSACVLGVKRMGLNRRRGRGKVEISIFSKEPHHKNLTNNWFELFKQECLND